MLSRHACVLRIAVTCCRPAACVTLPSLRAAAMSCRIFRQIAPIRSFKPNRGTGDQGLSQLYTNERRWKDDAVFEALGTTDELSSVIGYAPLRDIIIGDVARLSCCRELCQSEGVSEAVDVLTKVQCCLQDVGATLATPVSHESREQRSFEKRRTSTRFDGRFVDELNLLIDSFAADLPPLTNFILAGGGVTAAHLHVARTVCRRAERRVAPLIRQDQIEPTALVYLNRLSDLLFVLARYVCHKSGSPELAYRRPTTTTQRSDE